MKKEKYPFPAPPKEDRIGWGQLVTMCGRKRAEKMKQKISSKKNGLVFRVPSEHESQAAVVAWARLNEKKYPGLELLHAIPNGFNKSQAGAMKAQREGLKAGVPDLCLPVARKGAHGLYIEMKKKGGKPSVHQKWWAIRLQDHGYFVYLCFSAKEAISVIEDYFK